MARYAFIINQSRCVGCNACVVACQQSYHLPKENQLNWVNVKEEGKYPQVKLEFKPMLCGQCDNPTCVTSCPVDGATYQRKDGIVIVDEDKCIGCGVCVGACPYGARSINKNNNKVVKCTFCVQEVTNDDTSYCVKTCPTDARMLVDLDNLTPEQQKWLDKGKRLEERNGVKPFIYHII
ncbi:4Fe-4S dicluster domain-containing protein [Anaerobranca gottschalkii]|uniref:Fe-S-cluster-containing dehydrogenase component n=1 Tax=Anaerobranca gottschalkii DSM 13577 TaxID=1120990 RepID=A0A1H9YRQ0_9FIRM|nr:4Fe-4S dicluster domain-containing protein [Anaerobranca gottschalkii]SES71211.1 Fe-S-cluster-containing dehydrogenase component [Anaerobranca gottschalkii DSM 13577]